MYRRPSALAALRRLRRVPFSRSASAAALRRSHQRQRFIRCRRLFVCCDRSSTTRPALNGRPRCTLRCDRLECCKLNWWLSPSSPLSLPQRLPVRRRVERCNVGVRDHVRDALRDDARLVLPPERAQSIPSHLSSA